MNTDKIEEAAAAIVGELERGLYQDEEAASAVEGFFGTLDPGELSDLLSRREESEGATLYSMLVFPDAAMKERLEPLLSRLCCDAAEARAVAELVAERVGGTEAVFPGGARIALAMEPGDAREFTDRLHLKDNPPPALVQGVREAFSPRAAVGLLTALRRSRLRWTQPRLFFLTMLTRGVEGGTAGTDDAEAAFLWALGYLDALGEEADPAEALAPWIRELDTRLKTARRNKTILEQGNFETLMSQGVRLPYIHEESAARELRLARLVRRAVSGDAGDDDRMESDLGSYDDPAALIDALGGLD